MQQVGEREGDRQEKARERDRKRESERETETETKREREREGESKSARASEPASESRAKPDTESVRPRHAQRQLAWRPRCALAFSEHTAVMCHKIAFQCVYLCLR